LLALLLAACVGVAAWAGLIALRRSAPPDRDLPSIAPIVAPARPSRLPAAAEFERNALPAAARRTDTGTLVEVHIPTLPASLRGIGAGLATYDARTGADFAWLPIADVPAAADGSVTLQASTRVRGDLHVSFATAPEWARHCYLARTTVVAGTAAAEGRITLQLPLVIDTVRLVLPEGAGRAGPLRLSRCDDPQWLPTVYATTGIEVLPGRPTDVLLGAGAYELIDPIDATRRQRFEVPSTGAVVLTPTLTAVRGDRP